MARPYEHTRPHTSAGVRYETHTSPRVAVVEVTTAVVLSPDRHRTQVHTSVLHSRGSVRKLGSVRDKRCTNPVRAVRSDGKVLLKAAGVLQEPDLLMARDAK